MIRWVLAAALALSPLLGAAAAEGPVRRLALIVAHPNGGPDTETLQYTERDAFKVADVLTELGGFDRADMTFVASPTADELMTALGTVEAKVRAARAAGERPLLLFYYSGHAAAGELRLGASRLSFAQLRDAIRASHADIRIAFLDACQSGAITRLKGGRRAPSFVVDVDPDRAARGTVVITSSSDNEASQESDTLRGSFFTHHLVSGLRGAADRSDDAAVTLSEAYAYAYHRTVAQTAGTRGGTQHPTFVYDLEGNGDVVLTRVGGRGALVFPEAGDGEYLVYDRGRDVVVGEVAKVVGQSQRLSVPAGQYTVKKRAPDHVLLQDIAIVGTEQKVVGEGAFRAVAFEADVTKGPVWIAARRTHDRAVVLSARLGYQAFFDSPSRDELFHPSGMLGVRLEWLNALTPGISAHVDAAAGATRSELSVGPYAEAVPVDFVLAVGGVGLSFDWWVGDVLFQAGPRLSALYARRQFQDDLLPFQDLFTFSPGAELGVTWRLADFVIGLAGRAHYLRYSTVVEDRSLGFGEGYLTLGYAP